MNNLKKLSVIIPAYNVEKFLVKCVESVVNQTYKNIEIIIVNNGSSDGTAKICEELANKYNNIKVVTLNPNQGVNLARRAGVEAASGEYITFVDSDDYIDLNAYAKVIKILEENDCDIVQFGYYTVRSNGKIISEYKHEEAKIEGAHNAFKYFMYIIPENSVLVWDKVYKRELFENLEWPKLTYYEDFAANIQLFAKAKKFMAISDNFYYHVIHNAQVSFAPRIDKEKLYNDMTALKFLVDFTAKTMPECLPEMLYHSVYSYFGMVSLPVPKADPEIKKLIMQCEENLSRNYKLMKSELKRQGRKLNVKVTQQDSLKQKIHLWLLIHCPKFYKFYLRTRLKIKALTGI